ncbi:MAG: cytochrome b/b6 domain-containing protein [Hyphomicrobiales bacterium]|nr:cytochrome b/b6 domain-containing protein [Hyphomicrobiales bacterium]MCP5371850.1 cytochrome b/b6 domain-containing protein [Hyphomicrobiales bacterium]
MNENRDTVRVWDLPTRLFHWSLVAAVAAAWITAEVLDDRWLAPHYWIGYAVAGLLLFRLVWGLIGSEHSRFASFAYGPRRVLAHLRDLLGRRAGHYLGHNPAGAAMIFALLTLLALLVVTGLVAQGGAEHAGPLAGWVGTRVGHAAEELHEGLFVALLVLVAGHLGGVALESLLSRQNLVRAMVTGRKARPAGPQPDGT